MDRKSKNEPSASGQIERFKETARQLGCDEDEAVFDEKLGKIARHKPMNEPPGQQDKE